MTKIYILYHGGCQDGLGAKYAAWTKYGDDGATYYAVNYNEPMPKMDDDSEVYIFDFSYSKPELETLNKRMAKVVVQDHHKSAEEALKGLDFAFFDMNRSGAVMAWNYFHPDEEVPELLKRIQDRDLWRWQYKDTREVTSALQTYGDQMKTWWSYIQEDDSGIAELFTEGTAIESYKAHAIDRAIRPHQITFRVWRGFKVAIVNSNDLQSEIGAKLYTENELDFVIIYSINGAGLVNIGLRSRPGQGTDVSRIALNYGGGGHRNAAGCTAPTTIIHEWFSSTFHIPKEEKQ